MLDDGLRSGINVNPKIYDTKEIENPVVHYLKKLSAHSLTFLPSSRHFLGSFSSQRQSMNSLLGLSHWEPKWWAAAFRTADDTLIWTNMDNKETSKIYIFIL